MDKAYSGPKALTGYILYQSKRKAEKKWIILLIQGMMAGMYISLGAVAYFQVIAHVADPGLGSFLGALIFPLGIIAILLMQAELFTSDTMVMIAVFRGRTKIYKTLRILLLILIANLIGAIFVAAISVYSGIFDAQTMQVIMEKAVYKGSLPISQLLLSSILCNIIVCTSVCLAYSCGNEMARIIVVWLGITVFALSGTEHVVANMYFLFAGYFAGAEMTLLDVFYNLSLVTVGNFIGGGLIVSGINYMLVYRDVNKENKGE